MLIADAVTGGLDGLGRQLAVFGGDRNQLAARPRLRGATFVGLDVRPFGAQHRVMGLGERLQREHVGGRPVENGKHFRSGAEMLAECALGGARPRVVTVADDVAGVGSGDGLQDVRMDARVVVARETAPPVEIHVVGFGG